ncbi:FCD domain-containing protein [Cupriavidus sp. 8B]
MARLTLEPAICAMAERAASPADMERSGWGIYCASGKPPLAWMTMNIGTWRYISRSLARWAALLTEMVEMLNRKRHTAPWRRFRLASLSGKNRRVSDAQHEAIVDAIRRRQTDEAAAAMRAHLTTVMRYYPAEPG